MLGGLFVGVWVARYLGPADFGTLNYALALSGLFAAVSTVGLNGLIVRDVVRVPQFRGEILGSALALRATAGIVTVALIQLTAWLVRPDEAVTRAVVAVVSLAVVTRRVDVLKPWFESQVKSKYTVIGENSAFLVLALVRVALILLEAPLISFAVAIAVEAVLSRVFMWAFFLRLDDKTTKLSASISRVKSQLAEGWPLILAGLAVGIYMKIDQFMLGTIVGDQAVGIYAAAVRVSEIWYFVPVTIVASVMPRITMFQKENPAKYEARFQQLFSLLTLLSYVVIVGTTLFGPFLIVTLFGDSYSEAGLMLILHIWAALFVGLGVSSSRWLINEGLTSLSGFRTATGALFNVVLNLILIPAFGGIGAAVATVISQAIATFLFHMAFRETRPLFLMQTKALALTGIRRGL